MPRVSAFISDKPYKSYKSEFHYYVAFGAILALCGLLLLSLPIFRGGAVLSFAVSWLLFISAILAIVRPMLYRRGLPDYVMGLISAFFYGFVGYIAGGSNLMDIEGYRLAICAVLIFMGLARLLVFSRLISVAAMPMLLICFAADLLSGVLLLWGVPSAKASSIYWYAGMILLVDGVESVIEAVSLTHHVEDGQREEA